MRILLLIAFALWPLSAAANTLIDLAEKRGMLDAQTALLYRLYALRTPERVPAHLRDTTYIERDATRIALAAAEFVRSASPGGAQKLALALNRPERAHQFISLSGHFRLHYDSVGRHAVDPSDTDQNGTPDYIDTAAAIADSAWHFELDELAYRTPPNDDVIGGGHEIDIYVSALTNYGFATPEFVSTNTATAFLEIDNDYQDDLFYEPGQTPGIDGLRVTLAHEFFHAVQFGYYARTDAYWWLEATATWMEEQLYPQVDNYLAYLPAFLTQPERSLDSRFVDVRTYGGSLFAFYIAQEFGRDTIRLSWEEFDRRDSGSAQHLGHVLPKGLGEAIGEFALWNLFTAERHGKRAGYVEGARYPAVRTRDFRPAAKAIVQEEGFVDHLASAYIRLEPDLKPGGVEIELSTQSGSWRHQLVLIARDSVEVRPMREGKTLIADWDEYEEIVAVISSTAASGFGYTYRFSAHYDPDLRSQAMPATFALGGTYPNPFSAGNQREITFPFSLDQPSRNTRLAVYTVDGQLVREFDLGARAARAYKTDTWDGRNTKGQPVPSGVYYYALDADGRLQVGKLAIISPRP